MRRSDDSTGKKFESWKSFRYLVLLTFDWINCTHFEIMKTTGFNHITVKPHWKLTNQS